MGSENERPSKRAKILDPHTGKDISDRKITPNSRINIRSKGKTTSVNRLPSIINDIKPISYTSNKKAVSYDSLNREKEEKKRVDVTKNLNGFIDLDSSDADVSFKVLSSSQEFNIDHVVGKTVDKHKSTPQGSKIRPSSDDGIFWIDTSDRKDSLDRSHDYDVKLSSSPLRNLHNDIPRDQVILEEYDAFDLIDPELKDKLDALKLLHESHKDTLVSKPDFGRSKSDPKGLENRNIENKSFKQVINRKRTIEETLQSEKIRTSLLHQSANINIASMLTQIGDSLSVKQENSSDQRLGNEISAVMVGKHVSSCISGDIAEDTTETKKYKQYDDSILPHDVSIDVGLVEASDGNSSDEFSDDIDLDDPEVDKIIATQAPAFNNNNNIDDNDKYDESDDTFSDDDELFEKEMDRVSQYPRNASTRPNTDQTDVAEFEIDTKNVMEKMKNIDLTKSTSFSKYKGLAHVSVSSRTLSDESNKGFQLHNEEENLAKTALSYDCMTRLQIKQINESFKNGEREYVLKCSIADDSMTNVYVRDHWAKLDFQLNDVIHIITAKKGDNFRIVNARNNLLVWNPDILISATTISSSVECKRRALINAKLAGPGPSSIPMIVGNIVHAVFQRCLLHKCTDESFVNEVIDDQIGYYELDIFSLDKTVPQIKDMIKEHYMYIKEWIDIYTGGSAINNKKTEYRASKILDIEEDIMSPVYGMRGIVDVMLEAEIDSGKFVIPMEIKTGRRNIANYAQASLYTLLIKQRYGVDSKYLSLVFTKERDCVLQLIQRGEISALVNIRNAISQYMVYGSTKFPPLLKSQSTCERCFVREPCMVINKLTEGGSAEESGIDPGMYDEYTEHIDDDRYKSFFTRWDDLITKEEGLGNHLKQSLWCKTSKERESDGGEGVGNLTATGFQYVSSRNEFVYIFERDATVNLPLNYSNLMKHDRIILSEESSNFGLATGVLKLITADAIIFVTKKNWTDSAVRLDGFEPERNQTFKSVTHPENDLGSVNSISDLIKSKKFRLDKDALAFGMKMARYNLLNLFMPEGDVTRRELIVEHREPKFSEVANFEYKHVLEGLNEDQAKAVETTAKIEDYCLILGMPGTGKTTVISEIIDCIVKSGMSVLISSHTHSAVDNICEKLIKNAKKRGDSLPLLRLGSPTKISSVVQPYALHSSHFNKNVVDKETFEDVVTTSQIVASTCLGISDVIFGTAKRYDYCIIDEASQVSLPIILGPLSFCDRFILVGDHYQLPPLVRHPEAKLGGLDQSLFKILSEKHPQSVVELTHQYRMCDDIMSLSNELIYNGRLKCGSADVANQKLNIHNFGTLPINGTCVEKILDPERRVVFVNGDNLDSIHEVSKGDKVDNPGEASFITSLIKVLLLGGIKGEDIGVMSFYNAQLKHFYLSLKKYSGIEILTADRFQGRDKDVIIISLVRTAVLGDLLKEWRRVNVAITRARCKLIIFGSKKLLENEEQFEGFMQMIKENGWDYDLKEGDDHIASNIDFGCLPESQINTEMGDAPESQSILKTMSTDSKVVQRTKLLKYVIGEIIE